MELEILIGDLWEEYTQYVLPQQGKWCAMRWLARQIAGSLWPLFVQKTRRGDLIFTVLAAQIFAGIPLLALDGLWAYVYSQIPLKESTGRPLELLCVNLVCALLCSYAGGRIVQGRCGVIFAIVAALSYSLHIATTPLWYAIALPLVCAFSAARGSTSGGAR